MKPWQERLLTGALCAVFVPSMLFAALWLIGSAVESYGEHREAHDRCLKRATNGYEIRQCGPG